MSTWIDIDSEAGPIRGWRADPTGPSKGAVVVVQEIFGVSLMPTSSSCDARRGNRLVNGSCVGGSAWCTAPSTLS